MQEIRKSVINASETKFQVVKLEEKFFRNSNIKELFAYFSEENVTLKRVQADKVKNFLVSAEAADDFAAAWMAFRAECTRVDEEEAGRRVCVAFEVTAICSHYPEIVIQKHQGYNGGEYWSITCSKLSYYTDATSTVDQLLTEVTSLKERIDQGRAEMKAIKDIIATHPEIRLEPRKENGVTVAWHIQASFNSLGWTMMVRYARNVTELLEEVQAAQIEVATVKESYRIAGEHGLTITKTGMGWDVCTSEAETVLQTRTHKVEDLIRTVCEVVNSTSPQTPEPAQTDTTPSHDEMQMLETVQEHLGAPQTSAEHVSKAFGLALTTQEFNAINALDAE